MNGGNEQFNNWKSVLDYKAQLLFAQIAHIQSELTDAATAKMLCEPYYAMLESMYSEDYPLVNAIENSDLVVRLEGEGINKNRPRLSVITSYFEKVKKQVTTLAKALADIDISGRMRIKEFDLALTAYAKGSIVLGFSLPKLEELEVDNQKNLFGEEEPFYKAAREAMKTLGVVSHLVAKDSTIESVIEAVPDAKVRDVALSAVKALAPSGRQGVSNVSIAGKEIGDFGEVSLTRETKQQVKETLQKPVESSEIVTFYGQVRELDLDAHRFELRHIENEELNEVRCIYKGFSDAEASKWINRSLHVTGVVVRDVSGKARLMEAETII